MFRTPPIPPVAPAMRRAGWWRLPRPLNLLRVFAHRPLVLPLATVGALAMVAISELAYQQTVSALAQLAPAALSQTAAGQALEHSLQMGRVGVVVLSLISLVALFLVHRQGLALQQRQQQRQHLTLAQNLALEAEVAQRTADLVALAQHLQTAREDERQRLARDLHDELGALLTAAKLDAARIRSRLAGTAPEALERLSHLVASLDGVIALQRSISENLHPMSLGQLGLVDTLHNLAGDFSRAAGIPVHCKLQPVQLQPQAQLIVFRLVQEAITNISKYARAGQVWLNLRQADGQVHLEVRDDGVGFDPATLPRASCGLMGMRYRVQAEHGSLQLASAPGQGTCIAVQLPAAAAAPA